MVDRAAGDDPPSAPSARRIEGAGAHERELVRAALARLGLRNLVLAVHDPSFPSEPDEDTGHGSPSSRGGRAFIAEVAALGFNGLMLGPEGQVTVGNPSPYDATVFSRSLLGIAVSTLGELPELAVLAEEAKRQLAARIPSLPPARRERVDYAQALAVQGAMLRELHRFARALPPGHGGAALDAALRAFRQASASWLERDALYAACVREHGHDDWRAWRLPDGSPHPDQRLFADETASATRRAELAARYADEVDLYLFQQYLAERQHAALRHRLASLGLRLYGDLQIGLSLVDRWAHAGVFLPGYLMGAPPSRTNPEGQPWGYPVLHPRRYGGGAGTDDAALALFRARARHVFAHYDAVRIDHPHGLVDPWVYRASDPEPLRAVQTGARLLSSPADARITDHPELAPLAIARADQLAPAGVARHADDWVRELEPAQVERYAVLVDALVAAARERGLGASALVCEVLSTLPYPVGRVLARHGLGRFRVTQKVVLADPADPYRSENAAPEDWIMVGTHDTRPLGLVVDEWLRAGTAGAHAAYLAERLSPSGAPGARREALARRIAASRETLLQAKLAELFTSRAENVLVFFTDLFGMREVYNRPGTVGPENWSLRVPPDHAERYARARRAGEALDLPLALALALRARPEVRAADAGLAARLEQLALASGSAAAARLLAPRGG